MDVPELPDNTKEPIDYKKFFKSEADSLIAKLISGSGKAESEWDKSDWKILPVTIEATMSGTLLAEWYKVMVASKMTPNSFNTTSADIVFIKSIKKLWPMPTIKIITINWVPTISTFL